MPLPTRSQRSRPQLLRSPVWDPVLRDLRVEVRLAVANQGQRTRSPTLARESASTVLARAHTRLLATLGAGRALSEDTVSELVDAAVALIGAVPLLWSTHAVSGHEDRLPLMVGALEYQLSAREHGVLSGEMTYSLSVAEAEEPAVCMRQSLAALAGRDHGGTSDLISVQIAAIELAALLVRAAGNVLVYTHAAEAPEDRTPALSQALRRVGREIETQARAHAGALGEANDEIGNQLARALRASGPTRLADLPAVDDEALPAIRDAWLDVGALEHIAVASLAAKLETSIDQPRFKTSASAIAETAANAISGARLLARADAFRHDEAWRKQSTALGRAREIYVNWQPRAPHGFERAQGIVLTRLVRATVAITLIDLRGAIVEPVDAGVRAA